MITEYHAKYFAYDLTRKAPSAESAGGKISTALYDAAVDLNPHQVEAALFAMGSPLAKGVILTDEVGLGKTIRSYLHPIRKPLRQRAPGRPLGFGGHREAHKLRNLYKPDNKMSKAICEALKALAISNYFWYNNKDM